MGSLRPRHWSKVQRYVSNVAGVNFTVAVVVAEYWVKLTHVQKQNANVAQIYLAAQIKVALGSLTSIRSAIAIVINRASMNVARVNYVVLIAINA